MVREEGAGLADTEPSRGLSTLWPQTDENQLDTSNQMGPPGSSAQPRAMASNGHGQKLTFSSYQMGPSRV